MNAHITGSDLKGAQGKAITLADGKTYHLVFDLNAMEAMEERYGTLEKAMNSLSSIGDGKSKVVPDIRFMLWAALQHDNDNLTEHEAGKLITVENMNEIMDALNAAMQVSAPEADEKNAKNPQET